MKSHEQILRDARNRWKCHGDTESLINEVKSLLFEIENLRNIITRVTTDIREGLNQLRREGGE